jgi:hypothetical protein
MPFMLFRNYLNWRFGDYQDPSVFFAVLAGHLVFDNYPMMCPTRALIALPATRIEIFFLPGFDALVISYHGILDGKNI